VGWEGIFLTLREDWAHGALKTLPCQGRKREKEEGVQKEQYIGSRTPVASGGKEESRYASKEKGSTSGAYFKTAAYEKQGRREKFSPKLASNVIL